LFRSGLVFSYPLPLCVFPLTIFGLLVSLSLLVHHFAFGFSPNFPLVLVRCFHLHFVFFTLSGPICPIFFRPSSSVLRWDFWSLYQQNLWFARVISPWPQLTPLTSSSSCGLLLFVVFFRFHVLTLVLIVLLYFAPFYLSPTLPRFSCPFGCLPLSRFFLSPRR